MKTAIIFILIMLPILSFCQCDPLLYGKLKAEVIGHSVILRDDSAWRNCGVQYDMQVSTLKNDTLVWMQKMGGALSNCLCYYNLSVTIDSLKTGLYTAKVYYSNIWPTFTCYVGSIHFEITEPFNYYSPFKLGQFQSNCFPIVVAQDEKSMDNVVLKVFPNPTQGILNIETELKGSKLIRISDIENKTIFEIQTDKEENAIDLSYLPKALYFVTVWNNDKSLHNKFLKY
jgi:hypothetical protein